MLMYLYIFFTKIILDLTKKDETKKIIFGFLFHPSWILGEREMNVKWTWTWAKKWAMFTHVHELKFGKNMSQIWATFMNELKWMAFTFIFSYLCR